MSVHSNGPSMGYLHACPTLNDSWTLVVNWHVLDTVAIDDFVLPEVFAGEVGLQILNVRK